jgi:hypothetical protein
MAITRSQMKRQLYSIGGGAIKGTDAGNGREGFFRPVPGSPMTNFLNTLPPGDLRHYGIGFGGGPGYKNLGASTGGGFGPQTGNEAIYPRLGDLRSGVSSAEQELQDILQSINQVQSTLGAPSEGDGYPKIPAGAIAAITFYSGYFITTRNTISIIFCFRFWNCGRSKIRCSCDSR